MTVRKMYAEFMRLNTAINPTQISTDILQTLTSVSRRSAGSGQIVEQSYGFTRDESFETENGIAYRNVEEYLKNDIVDFSLEQVVDNDIQSGRI